MQKKPKVSIKPEILKWARTSLHLTEEEVIEHFKKKTKLKYKIDFGVLQSMEGSEQQITFALLMELAALYKRPLSVFFLEAPLKEKALPKDRRTLGSKVHSSFSRDGILTARKARRIQAVTAELYQVLKADYRFPFKKYNASVDAEALGVKIREAFDLTFEKQRSFRGSSELFAYLRNSIESFGVVTLKQSFPLEDARAFSLTDAEPYVIVINSKDGDGSYAPKVFSLMHEFAHLLLREGALCNDFLHSHQSIESFCNRFAAAFLVPHKEFLKEYARVSNEHGNIDDQLKELQKSFNVSQHVLLRRYFSSDLLTRSQYEKKVDQWQKDFEQSNSLKNGSYVPIVEPFKKAFANNGRLFTTLVLQAHSKNMIGYDSVADYLSVKIKHIPALENYAMSKV